MFDDDIFPTLSCPLGHGLFIMAGDCPLWICPNCGAYLFAVSMMNEAGCLRFATAGGGGITILPNVNPAVTVH